MRYLIILSLSDSTIQFFSLLLQITTADGEAGKVLQVQVMILLWNYMTYVWKILSLLFTIIANGIVFIYKGPPGPEGPQGIQGNAGLPVSV